MAVLLTSYRKKLNILYTGLALLMFVLIPILCVYNDGETSRTLLDGEMLYITCIYFISLTLSCVFAWLGKNIPTLIFGLPYFVYILMACVMIMLHYSALIGLLVLFSVVMLQLVLLLLFFRKKGKTYAVKFVLAPREIITSSLMTILLLAVYFYAKGKYCVFNFDPQDGYYQYNLFSTFHGEVLHGNAFELIMSILIFFVILLSWVRKHKISFILMMVFAAGSIVAFFYTLNCWARTDAFTIWTILSLLSIFCSILILYIQLPKVDNTDEKLEKLKMLNDAGLITEEKYQKEVSKISPHKTEE